MSRPHWITPPPEEVLDLWRMARPTDPPTSHAAARRTDPTTSHAAAAQSGELATEHREQILAALAEGPAGVSGIAARCGLSNHQVNKRITELERSGLVVLTGRLVRSSSGRGEREWKTVERQSF